MTNKATEILREAMLLSPDERAELADRLLDTLQSAAQRKIDEERAAESEDRIDAYERGEMGSVPAEEAFELVRKRLAQGREKPV